VVYTCLVKKIRMNVFLLARQMKRLEDESKKTGSSVAELIRRAIDGTYPEKEASKK
jgi:ribbon-helix-helix CopG family protein